VLQKFNARILYLAQCKIDGIRPCGGLGFAKNELKEIMFEEEAKVLWFILALHYYIHHTSH
jgi:hypothetical protein